MLDLDGFKLAIVTKSQHPPHIAFRVDGVDDLGTEYSEHRDGSKYIYKEDPDGNTVEFICWQNDDTQKSNTTKGE